MKRFLLFVLAAAMATAPAFAQDGMSPQYEVETNTIYYMVDKASNAESPDGRFGSNNYLKLDYTRGRLSIGVQFEGYFPSLLGYNIGTYGEGKKFFLANKYVRWQDENFTVHVGDIYEQFGSGLVFRSFEDRTLGINNSIEGVFASYNFNNYVQIKGLYGRPRLYDYYADSWVRGADLSVSINDMFNTWDWVLSLEGSYINRHENKADYPLLKNANTNLVSGRLNFEYSGFYLSGEYVDKDRDLGDLPGNAILAEAGYTGKGFAAVATFRKLRHMDTPLTYAMGMGGGLGQPENTLNFIPALTRQYTYLLTNLHPYQVDADDEIGGQFDAYYTLRGKNDRRKKWSFHLNFSTYYMTQIKALLWRDLNIDIERQWNKKLKTSFLYSWQTNNAKNLAVDLTGKTSQAHIFVYDMTYKIDTYNSFRLELQYLYSPIKGQEYYITDYNEGDWVAALFEYNFAPNWSFYASDMYNIDQTKTHYYNAGFSYSKGRTRIQLSYGRNRAGYICSGGACRYNPAYTGFNLSLTSAF